MPRAYGLFVGINYEGTGYGLQGCINDAKDYNEAFGAYLHESHIMLEQEATKEKILAVLAQLVGLLRYRDTLIFTFSGHGTWLPDKNGDEPDGKDEAICPWDVNAHVILDDELQAVIGHRVRGSKIIFISDCCHSGTVFRLMGTPELNRKIRFLPPARLEFLSEAIEHKAERREREVLQANVIRKENKPISGLLHFAGCQDTEYSYDAYIDGRPCGAFTHYFLDAYNSAPPRTSWEGLQKRIAESLPSYEYPQRPKLNGLGSDKRSIVMGK